MAINLKLGILYNLPTNMPCKKKDKPNGIDHYLYGGFGCVPIFFIKILFWHKMAIMKLWFYSFSNFMIFYVHG